MSLNPTAKLDFVIVGGGLQGCLLALALRQHQPEATVLVLEKSRTLCGNHTWSFHQTDLTPECGEWFLPLVDHHWPSYDVQFGAWRREVPIGYGTLFSHSLAQHVERARTASQGKLIVRQADVIEVEPHRVKLADGESITGRSALDCRGLDRNQVEIGSVGFQKFAGFEVEIDRQWPHAVPTLMDDRIDQQDGFRFWYTLPFAANRILVEDTRFSNHPDFSPDESLVHVREYLARHGIQRFEVIRRESGCLPMPYRSRQSSMNALGYRGGLFHAATGYSIPLAANLAEEVASKSPEESFSVIEQFRRRHRFPAAFSRWLNRMLFRLVKPDHRHKIFERFYQRLPVATIERFYGHRFGALDACRLVVGRPPSGLTPFQFLQSFREKSCSSLAIQ